MVEKFDPVFEYRNWALVSTVPELFAPRSPRGFMRSITPVLLAVTLGLPASLLASPTHAEAAGPNRMALGPKAPKAPKVKKSVLNGAGQRLHFSFGGRIVHDPTKNTLKGKFRIIVHPLAPPGSVVNTVCRYTSFNNPQLEGRTLDFDAHGTCTSLGLDGRLTKRAAHNHITIVDSIAGTDAIDVDAIGTGISIPGGELSHGSFTFVGPGDQHG